MTNQRLLSRFCHQYGICLAESKDASDLLQKVLSGEEREETAAFHRLLTSRLGKGHCLGQSSTISLAD